VAVNRAAGRRVVATPAAIPLGYTDFSGLGVSTPVPWLGAATVHDPIRFRTTMSSGMAAGGDQRRRNSYSALIRWL
jgi:hypothetical protein